MSKNIILDTDSYKSSHFMQYPPKTAYVCSYIEPRHNNFGFEIEGVVHFGPQMWFKDISKNPVTMDHVHEAEEIFHAHGEPFNKHGWMDIVQTYHGVLPVTVESLPEGTVVPAGTPTVQIYNNDPKHYWLTSYLETSLLRAVWYPSTVATLSREIKRVIYKYLVETADDPDASIPFKLHDFGARGVSSYESSAIGGLAHLVNFMGTDTVASLGMAKKYYFEYGMPAYSIPAAEHSTITSWGEYRETDAYINMVEQFGGEGKLYAVVSDSYDLYNAISNIWGGTLRDRVLSKGGTLVVRPDSGIPEEVVLKCLVLLEEKFGSSLNSKGYKLLPKQIRLIQGDGVNYFSIKKILETLKTAGWSADNVAFGMGGALLQQINRDQLSWAMKCNAIRFDDSFEWVPVQKKPKTDPLKNSKAGKIIGLPISYSNGAIHSPTSFKEVRSRAALKLAA